MGTAGGLRPAAGRGAARPAPARAAACASAGLPFRIFRNEERLARSSLSRDRSRTALTAGALVVGVAMVVALGTAAQDVRKIGSSWLAETIPGSELLTSIRPVSTTDPIQGAAGRDAGRQVGLAHRAVRRALRLDDADGGRTEKSVVRQEAAAIVGHDYLADGRLDFIAGDRTAALDALDSGGSVIVPEVAGRRGGHQSGRRDRVRDRPDYATSSASSASWPTPSRPNPRRRSWWAGRTRWRSSA